MQKVVIEQPGDMYILFVKPGDKYVQNRLQREQPLEEQTKKLFSTINRSGLHVIP